MRIVTSSPPPTHPPRKTEFSNQEPPKEALVRVLAEHCMNDLFLCNAGIEPEFLKSPALAGMFFTTSTTWELLHIQNIYIHIQILYTYPEYIYIEYTCISRIYIHIQNIYISRIYLYISRVYIHI